MHRPIVVTLILAAVLATASVARADDCADAQTQADMNICADKAYQKADGALNKVYAEIKQRLAGNGEATKQLVAAQRAWIAFRDAECAFAASGVSGGSIYPTIYAGCLEDITLARVENLKDFLSCQEGDPSCPVPPQ
jgi:uncharacterized protein YecT (DUF1311 family)